MAVPSLRRFTLHLERVEQQEREEQAPVAVIASASAVDTVYSCALQRAQSFQLPQLQLPRGDFVSGR